MLTSALLFPLLPLTTLATITKTTVITERATTTITHIYADTTSIQTSEFSSVHLSTSVSVPVVQNSTATITTKTTSSSTISSSATSTSTHAPVSYIAPVSTGTGANVTATAGQSAPFPNQSGASGVGAPNSPASASPFLGTACERSVDVFTGGMLALVAAGLAAW